MKIRILYFAVLREQAGRDAEERVTGADSAEALYREVRDEYGFSLPLDAMRMAVNDRFVVPSHRLADGDTIVFLPPGAGG
jgi:sulfur-carrier protein